VHEAVVKQIPISKTIAKIIFFISILAVFILSPAVLLITLFSLLYYGFSGVFARALSMEDIHTKKAWHYFAFIGISEVLDYLFLPITTIQPTPFGGSVVALFWEEF
jgi:hypothetical protein